MGLIQFKIKNSYLLRVHLNETSDSNDRKVRTRPALSTAQAFWELKSYKEKANSRRLAHQVAVATER